MARFLLLEGREINCRARKLRQVRTDVDNHEKVEKRHTTTVQIALIKGYSRKSRDCSNSSGSALISPAALQPLHSARAFRPGRSVPDSLEGQYPAGHPVASRGAMCLLIDGGRVSFCLSQRAGPGRAVSIPISSSSRLVLPRSSCSCQEYTWKCSFESLAPDSQSRLPSPYITFSPSYLSLSENTPSPAILLHPRGKIPSDKRCVRGGLSPRLCTESHGRLVAPVAMIYALSNGILRSSSF